jgi:hypothetical protein
MPTRTHFTSNPQSGKENRPLPSLSPVDRWIVEVHYGQFLRAYDFESGLTLTDCLTAAKLFSREALAREAASLFNGRIHRVLTDTHGSYPRIALLHNRSDW